MYLCTRNFGCETQETVFRVVCLSGTSFHIILYNQLINCNKIIKNYETKKLLFNCEGDAACVARDAVGAVFNEGFN